MYHYGNDPECINYYRQSLRIDRLLGLASSTVNSRPPIDRIIVATRGCSRTRTQDTIAGEWEFRWTSQHALATSHNSQRRTVRPERRCRSVNMSAGMAMRLLLLGLQPAAVIINKRHLEYSDHISLHSLGVLIVVT